MLNGTSLVALKGDVPADDEEKTLPSTAARARTPKQAGARRPEQEKRIHMHKIIQARRLSAALAVTAVAASGFAASPAMAKADSNKTLTRDVTKIDKTIAAAGVTLTKSAKNLQAQINALSTGLGTTNANLSTTQAALTSLQGTVSSLSSAFASASTTVTSALNQINTALTSINSALTNTTNGLEISRPRFVALSVVSNAFVIPANSSTTENTISIVSQNSNAVILNFGEDVSQRVFLVNGIAGANGIGQAIDCATAAAAGSPCFGTDSSKNHVLVTTEDALTTGTVAVPVPVTVVALAG